MYYLLEKFWICILDLFSFVCLCDVVCDCFVGLPTCWFDVAVCLKF